MFSLNKSVKNLCFYLSYSRSCAIPWRPEAVHSAGRKRSFLWPLSLFLPSLTDQCAQTHWVQTFPRCLSLPVLWLWGIKENQNCFGKTHAHVPDKNVTKWNNWFSFLLREDYQARGFWQIHHSQSNCWRSLLFRLPPVHPRCQVKCEESHREQALSQQFCLQLWTLWSQLGHEEGVTATQG